MVEGGGCEGVRVVLKYSRIHVQCQVCEVWVGGEGIGNERKQIYVEKATFL